MKRLLFAVLIFAVITKSAQGYSGGSGTADDPYKISNLDDLLILAAPSSDYGLHFILTADIDLSTAGTLTDALISPDTNSASYNFQGTAFFGVFDGDGHTISNLTINSFPNKKDHLGLFGKISGTGVVKNLAVRNISITAGNSTSNVGGLAGENTGAISNCNVTGLITWTGNGSTAFGGLAGLSNGQISNCYAKVTINGGDNLYATGGLAGYQTGGTISNSAAAGDISVGIGCWDSGGLVGYNSEGNIINCCSTSGVSGGNSTIQIGGLVGYNEGINTSNCFSTGNVTSGDNSYSTGGLAGSNGNSSNTSNSYSTGAVTTGNNSQYAGGLAGASYNSSIMNCYSTGAVTGANNSSYIGGLTGDNDYIINNCYSTGTVSGASGSTHIGGLAGHSTGFNISNCFFLNTSGPADGNGTALTAAQMKQQASFTGWNFSTVWRIHQNADYPKLRILSYSGGSGAASDPYQIAEADDLIMLAPNTNDYDINFILTDDIDLAWYSFETAVVAADTNKANTTFQGTYFSGVFDGNSHSIKNLSIDTGTAGNDYLGLFGASFGEIKNLGLKNISIDGANGSYHIGALTGANFGTISNCFSTGNLAGGDGSANLGGLAGSNYTSISNCYSTCSITGTSSSNELGGIAGWNSGTISNCFSTGSITGGNNSRGIGGIAGWNTKNITYCYSTCNVSGGDGAYDIGGLAGFNNGGNIGNCYATGAVHGGANSRDIGGLAGWHKDGIISDCYSTGVAAGTSFYGGFAGFDVNGIISDSYFLITSGPDNTYGKALTDKLMKQQSSFAGWDFTGETINGLNDVWWINEGKGLPKFYWQIDAAKCAVTAGTKQNTDKISLSGLMSFQGNDFTVYTMKVSIDSGDLVNPCILSFPINGTTFKNGKYKYSGIENGIKKSFSYDVKTRKFAFSAGNLDLSGLSCPMTVKIDINDCNTISPLEEPIVNAKKPIPIMFLMGVKDSLRVDKYKITKKAGVVNQAAISGAFTVKNIDDSNLVILPLDITIGSQTFTIPADKFKVSKGEFTCSNVQILDGSYVTGTGAAVFDFNKCIFTVTIKNTNFAADTGAADFKVEFGEFSEGAEVLMP